MARISTTARSARRSKVRCSSRSTAARRPISCGSSRARRCRRARRARSTGRRTRTCSRTCSSRTTSSRATSSCRPIRQQLGKMLIPAGGFSFMAFSPYVAKPAVDKPDPFARYTPVSEALLSESPAGDWLAWRRTYDAHGFSPLTQITPRNVAQLRVAWTWSLPPGSNESRAARARRDPVHVRVRRQAPGSRRAHGRPALAVLP